MILLITVYLLISWATPLALLWSEPWYVSTVVFKNFPSCPTQSINLVNVCQKTEPTGKQSDCPRIGLPQVVMVYYQPVELSIRASSLSGIFGVYYQRKPDHYRNLWNGYYYPSFADEETHLRRGETFCQGNLIPSKRLRWDSILWSDLPTLPFRTKFPGRLPLCSLASWSLNC